MLSYLCQVLLAWKGVSDIAAGAYNDNISKLGATLITCPRSNQRAINDAIAKEPRAMGSCGMKSSIARATGGHVSRACAKKVRVEFAKPRG